MMKNGLPEVLVRSVMREERRVSEWILNCQWSLRLMWGCSKEPELSPFFVVVAYVSELAIT